jgi:hypothetical protein
MTAKTLTAIFFFLFTVAAFGQGTDSMRCGNDLVSIGSSGGEVAKKCGEPAQASRREDSRVIIDPFTGAKAYQSVTVDDWMYNFGPDRFQYRIVMENGVVARIESLGKGY